MSALETEPLLLRIRSSPKHSWRGRWWQAALGLWLLTSIYIVNTQQQAVVTRFGAVIEPRVMPKRE